jgi:cysteine-dependent adenosine diphosphate thiazole synthase
MAPVAVTPQVDQTPISLLKQEVNGNGVNGKHLSVDVDVNEDYAGDYRFAPIEEAQVSRAMIKRFISFISHGVSPVV